MPKQQKDELSRGPTKGLEVYARNIKNAGVFASDSYAKIVTENYEGSGEISVGPKKTRSKSWYEKWWGILLLGALASILATILF